MQTEKRRKLYYDILRIIAILCVIYNHTNAHGYFLYAFPAPTILKIFYYAVGALIAVGVPIFFMISGALLLNRQESIETVYKKRVLRIFLVLIIFSSLQFIFEVARGSAELSSTYFFSHLISDNMVPSYWYLYAYLAYLTILPILQKLVCVMSDSDFKYLFGLQIAIEGVFQTVVYLFGYTELNSFFVIPMFNRVILFPLLGYYLEHRLPREKYTKKGLWLSIVAAAAVLAVMVAMSAYRNLPYEEFTTYDKGLYTCGLTTVLDIAVFYWAKYVFDVRRDEVKTRYFEKVITTIGSCVFGIYLIEGNVRILTEGWCQTMSGYIGMFPSCLVWVLFVFVISLAIAWLLKKIPGLKKLL